MLRAFIFDFDGTIADTAKIVMSGYNKFAVSNKLPIIDDKTYKDLRNLSAREIMKKYKVTPFKLFKLTRLIRAELKEKLAHAPIFPGIEKVIQELKKEGMWVGIITSNTEENVRKCLKNWNITNVDFVHGERNIFGKGAVLKKVIKRWKLSNEEVIYVGDEVRDIDAARQAGIRAMAVTWGFNSEKRLIEAQPDLLVDQPKNIVKKGI